MPMSEGTLSTPFIISDAWLDCFVDLPIEQRRWLRRPFRRR
jgi:hypothetical protein